MERFNKINRVINRLALLIIAVIGTWSVFIVDNGMQKPVLMSGTVNAKPVKKTALTIQRGETSAAQVALPATKPSNLETLVAPIALYPDLLLTQLLPASTYPLEVVQAAHWLESNPDLARVSGQVWASSITELLRFPQLIFMMKDRLDWTLELGDRFLVEPDSVLAAIQSMRARAMAMGLLKNSAEQIVIKTTATKLFKDTQQDEGAWVKVPAASAAVLTKQVDVIHIVAVNLQILHVPQYDPQILSSEQSPTPDISPASVYDSTISKTPARITFSAGVNIEALLGWAISGWDDDVWDVHSQSYYRQPHISHYTGNNNGYDRGADSIDIYRDENISVNKSNGSRKRTLSQSVQTPWVHDPLHRRGYLYPQQAQRRFAVSRQQPALAGQRRSAGQAVNSDYAGYERNELDRMLQNEVEKLLGQTIVSTYKHQDVTVQQEIKQSENQENQQQGDLQQSVQPRTQERTLSDEKPEEPVKTMPHSVSTSDRTVEDMSLTERNTEIYSVFSGVRAGSQAQTFGKRGQSSRTKVRIGITHDGKKRK